jgi:DNA-binding beta-propeller fold protein YncE
VIRGLGLALAASVVLTVDDPDPVSRADAARSAWRRASASGRAGLEDSAYADVRRAHEAWPMQPAYAEALARLAARRGDALTVIRVLTRLAAQEVGEGAATDTSIASLSLRDPNVATARDALRARLEGSARSEEIISGDTTFYAEGFAVDARTGARYVTSLKHRNVLVVGRDGSRRWLLAETPLARGAVMGVAIDGALDVAWLTTAVVGEAGRTAADSGRVAALLRVRLRDGAVEFETPLGDGTGAPGEISLTASGEVLVSDALKGRLYRLPRGAMNVTVVESRLLRSPQGIAPSADGAYAIVADWSHGLLRWDLTTNVVEAVAAPDDVALLGVDGLRTHGDGVLAVQNGVRPMRVAFVQLAEDGRRVAGVQTLDRPATAVGELTVGAIDGANFVYVASSQWPFWTETGARNARAGALPPVVLRSVALPRR